jgi:hypothetical protein
MSDVRIREAVVSMRVVDGDSLLSPVLLERIVQAVQAAMARQHEDEQARRHDTRLAASSSCGCDGAERGGGR